MALKKQTAGRDSLGEFAPKFAELNDDVLFGEVWSREDKLSLKMRSILTVSALVSKGLIDSSFEYHAKTAKANGVTKTEMAEILTHLAFYAGWPNAWAAFRIVKDVYAPDGEAEEMYGGIFGMGEPNSAYAKYFIGNSWLNRSQTHKRRCLRRTLRLNRAAETTGIFIKQRPAADKFCFVRTARAGTWKRAKRRRA